MSISKNSSGQWEVTPSTSAVTLDTASTFLDSDILVKAVSSDTAKSVLGTTNLSASLKDNTMETATSGDYYITPSASADINKVVSSSPVDGTTVYIKTATIATSLDTGNMNTYFSTGSSSSNSVTLTPKYTRTAGYAAAVTTATNNGGTSYWTIKSGTISSGTTNHSSDTSPYSVNTTSVPSDGYLYIGAGWYPNTQISLASLIPDSSNTDAANGNILYGYEAFDTSGTRHVGTIKTGYLGTAITNSNSQFLLSSDYYTTTNTGYGAEGAGYLNQTYYIKEGIFNTNITTESSSTSSNLPLITTAGWAPINYVKSLIVPAGDTFGSSTTPGLVLGVDENQENSTTAYIETNDASELYIHTTDNDFEDNHIYLDSEYLGELNNLSGSYIAYLYNNGTIINLINASGKTISNFTNTGTITSLSNNGTISNLINKGTVVYKTNSASTGTLTVNAYNNASTAALTGAQTITSNGKWVYPTVSAAGTYYGAVVVGAGTASLTPVGSTNATLSTTNNGISITGGSITKAGWLSTASAITRYISKIALTAPSSGNYSVDVQVPNSSSSTATFTFSADSSGVTTMTPTTTTVSNIIGTSVPTSAGGTNQMFFVTI